MTTGWQNSLDFLEDEHLVKKDFPITGELQYISENAIVVDVKLTEKGQLIQREFVLSSDIAPVALITPNRQVHLRFSAKYTGYHPIELRSFSFLEIPEHRLYGGSRLQASDCAEWRKFATVEDDLNAPGLVVVSYDEAGAVQKQAIVRPDNVAEGWFPANVDGTSYRPILLPGQKFYFGIKITPPSNPEYQILSADSFHIVFQFNFDELDERRSAQINDEDFEICVPV